MSVEKVVEDIFLGKREIEENGFLRLGPSWRNQTLYLVYCLAIGQLTGKIYILDARKFNELKEKVKNGEMLDASEEEFNLNYVSVESDPTGYIEINRGVRKLFNLGDAREFDCGSDDVGIYFKTP